MSQIIAPMNVIESVTHTDPYPFYSRLVSESPLYYDEALKVWVATSARTVTAVLTHPHCAVRPNSAPVPQPLIDTAAGIIFQHLVRMTDGSKHAHMKAAITQQTQAIHLSQVSQVSQYWAERLLNERNTTNLNQFAANLPVYVLANLIGISSNLIPTVAALIQSFARCLNPLNNSEQINQGIAAAIELLQLIQQETNTVFYSELADETSPDIAAANMIGLMFQSYEATAGLIGNALCTLAIYPELRPEIMRDNNLMEAFIKEVIRWNPSVHNTRRYLRADTVIEGEKMSNEEVIILVLAAANRDNTANPNPDEFRLHREHRQSYTFGLGHHACPGEMMAISIVQAGLKQILRLGVDEWIDISATTYKRYGNLRIPNLILK